MILCADAAIDKNHVGVPTTTNYEDFCQLPCTLVQYHSACAVY